MKSKVYNFLLPPQIPDASIAEAASRRTRLVPVKIKTDSNIANLAGLGPSEDRLLAFLGAGGEQTDAG